MIAKQKEGLMIKKEMREEVKEFIVKNFMQEKGTIKDDESLFEKNVIDSFGILELISFIEKKFRVSVNPSEVTIENFDSVDKIIKLIARKQKK